MDDFDFDFHGSTKKIISLVRNLPEADGKKFGHAFHHGDAKSERKQRRFIKHPRKLAGRDSEELLVIKQPSEEPILTDSSDEYCDVTIRRDDHLQDDDHILRNLKDSKLERSRANGVVRNFKQKKMLEKLALKEEEYILKGRKEEYFKLTSNHVKALEDEHVLMSHKENKILKELEDHNLRKGELFEKNKNVKELENREKKADDFGAEKEVKEARIKEDPKINVDLKLEGIITKSVQSVEDIRALIDSGIDPPDGSEDFCRRKKRAAEFAIRFSRIHLYQLNRLLGDIENILKPGPATNRNSNVALNQKFYMANQTIYQALQAYLKHLPSSIIIGLPDKLKEVLHYACNLCGIYKKHSDFNAQGDGQDDFIVNYEGKCRTLLDQIDLKVSIRPSASQSATNLSVLGYKTSRLRQGKINKFSMYHSVPMRADVYWKKAIASIAHKKFDVPSRYKTATYKHRPPPPPPQPQVVEKPPRKCCHKRSDKKPIPEVPNDIDNVKTLMEHQEEKQQSKLWSLAQSFFQKISKDNQKMTQGEYECILEHFISMIKGGKKETKLQFEHKEEAVQQLIEEKLGAPLDKMDFGEFVQKLLYCVNNNTPKSEENERMYVEDLPNEVNYSVKSTVSSKSTRKSSKERRQTLSVTGPKNAQLICIKDDESLIERSDDGRDHETESSGRLIYRERSEGELQGKTKLTRIGGKQGLKPLGMLPKDTIVRIIEYKLQFHRETKNECMYKKSGNMSSWILVERISEQLLEEVLQSITRDIQVDEILRKIYAHEFK